MRLISTRARTYDHPRACYWCYLTFSNSNLHRTEQQRGGPFPLNAQPLVRGHLWVANLVVTPVVVGLLMRVIGIWRLRQPVLRIDRFAYGYVFALLLAQVRFRLAQ